jgi:hypothetical protein
MWDDSPNLISEFDYRRAKDLWAAPGSDADQCVILQLSIPQFVMQPVASTPSS